MADQGDLDPTREQESATAAGRVTPEAAEAIEEKAEEGDAQGGKGRPPSDS